MGILQERGTMLRHQRWGAADPLDGGSGGSGDRGGDEVDVELASVADTHIH